MSTPSPAPRPGLALRRARLGVVATFFACGVAMAAWVVHIPALMESTGINESGLGGLLLVLGAAALAAMQLGGLLTARFGSRPVQAVGGILMVLGLLGASLSENPWLLGASLVLFGLGNGAVDLAMNEQAVRVERGYGRPIMGSCHAFYSVGGAIGAALGGGLLSLSLPAVTSIGAMAALALIGLLGPLPVLLPAGAHEQAAPGAAVVGTETPVPDAGPVPDAAGSPAALGADGVAPSPAAARAARAHIVRLGLLLGLLAFGFFLAEGTVNDWSARHAVEHLRVSDATAAAAFGVFSTAMTIGRFAADRISGRFGAVAVVRYGALLAAAGLLVVVTAPAFWAVVIGWGLYGLGLSGIIPQIFTAAGSLVPGPRGAVVLSRVVGAGYLGMLAGPAIVGWLAGWVGLNQALLLPLALCAAGVALSFALPGGQREPAERGNGGPRTP